MDKETFPEVDDDPYWVRGRYAKAHPVQLRKAKRFKAFGSVNPAKDPADVIPVRLVKNERIVVTVTAVDDSALLELSIFGPKSGDFDVSNSADRNRLIGTAGLSSGPDVELRAKSTGTYYVAVETVDAVDPDDPEAVVPDTQPYNISAYKQTPNKKAKRKKRR